MSEAPIVLAYHMMWTLYGWWLPNDPRGSTSQTIRSDLINELGEVHLGRKRIQPPGGEIGRFHDEAPDLLTHDLLAFNRREFHRVAEALGEVIEAHRYTCYACAIMPDHVHVLIRRHRDSAEEMIDRLQTRSRHGLIQQGVRDREHPVWTRGGWKVFLDHPDEIWRTIRYIENNPLKMKLPNQQWPFVQAYDNWPLHEGHSTSSPYVRALRRAGRYPR